jgi:hypothetical protein
MKTLNAYLKQKNSWNAVFGTPAITLATAQDRQRIAEMIDSELSPENLTCDGELSRTAVQQRYRQLTGAARELKQLDPAVTFYEYE